MKGTNTTNIVLLADDDLFVRQVIRSILKDVAQIVEVQDGAEVLTAYEQHNPDVVFLDVHLPNQSGLNLIKPILERDKDAYIIVISADSTLENVKTAKYEGCKGFLTKPFDKARVTHLFNLCPTIKPKDGKMPAA